MSELDRDGAKTLDDEDTDSIEEINDDTDDHVLVAEPTDRTPFQADLRAFFQLFNVVREQLTLKIMGQDKIKTNGSKLMTSGSPFIDNHQLEITKQC